METRSLLSFRFVVAILLLSSTFLCANADEVVAPPAPAPKPAPAPGTISTGTATTSSGTTGTTWSGCVDPVKGYQPVTIGEPTTICLVLASDGDWSTAVKYMRLNFSPTADVYSRFSVPQSFNNLVGSPNNNLKKKFSSNIYVHAESQTALSFQKMYYNTSQVVYPYLTAVIAVNEGKVTGITWDDSCVFCSAEVCQPNTYTFGGELATPEEAQQPVGGCPMAENACRLSQQAECDLMLYVVWTGTDSNGRDFTSSANRFSAFPKQSWSDRINLALPDWMNNINPFGNSDETRK